MKSNVNKEKLKRRFSRNAKQYDKYASIQKKMGDYLIYIQNESNKPVGRVLEIGCGTGYLTKKLLNSFNDVTIDAVDIAQGMIDVSVSGLSDTELERVNYYCCDIEEASIDEKYDLIISNATFQWFNNLDETLKKLNSMLNDGGEIVFSTFGDDTFSELRESFSHARNVLEIDVNKHSNHFFYSMKNLSDIVQNNVNLESSYEFLEKEYFNNCLDFMYSVKKIGANSSQENSVVHPQLISTVLNYYDSKYVESDKVYATYHLMFFKAEKLPLGM